MSLRTRRASRASIFFVMSLVVLAMSALPASAAVSCSFGGGTATVTMTGGGTATITRTVGGAIRVNGVACGAATVNNTNTVAVNANTGDQVVTIDQANGPFAPGATPEGSGVSEIEFTIALGAGLGDVLNVKGTSGDDTIVVGTGGINWNGDGDADITYTGVDTLNVYGQDGDDLISGQDGSGTGVPISNPMRFHGGNDDDTLIGGNGNDVLNGNAGDDRLWGAAGNDTHNGNIGDDTVDYSLGATNAIQASLVSNSATGDGADTFGTVENLSGGPNSDTLTGNGAANVLTGNGGNDTLNGNGGADTILPGLGNDTANGGAGVDTVSYADVPGGVTVDLALTTSQNTVGAGTDKLSAFENLTGSPGDDTLFGTSGPNVIKGLGGNDDIDGRGGNDTIQGGAGDDDMHGGPGTDCLDYSDAPGPVTIDALNGTATGHGSDTFDGFECYTPSPFGTTFNGTNGDDTFTGGPGNDTINGNGGNDILCGGPGDDVIYGGSGDDTLCGDAGNDELYGEAGNDGMTGGADDDYLVGGPDVDTQDGEGGNDTYDHLVAGADGGDTISTTGGTDTGHDRLFYDARTGDLTVTVGAGAADDGEAGEGDTVGGDVEEVHGGGGNDSISGDGSDETFKGHGGRDLLLGNGGADTLDGGPGHDCGYIAACGAGPGSYGVIGGSGNDILDGGDGSDDVQGGDDDDTVLNGTAMTNNTGDYQFGNGGTDTLDYSGRTNAVTIATSGGTGEAGEGDLNSGFENLTGGSGDDTLNGDSGPNVLDGNAGTDDCQGNGGADTYLDCENAPVTVTNASMQGWSDVSDPGNTASTGTGPGAPPLGVGSLHLSTGAGLGDTAARWRRTFPAGTDLSTLTALSYWTYMTTNNGQQFPYLYLTVDWDGDTVADDFIFFEPPFQNPADGNPGLPDQGTTALNTWQDWNALVGGWWSVNDPCCTPGTGVDSLATYLSGHAGADVLNINVTVGFASPGDDFDGAIDALTIGVGGVDTLYDFEP